MIIYDDDEASVELLSPASKRALGVNGHAHHMVERDVEHRQLRDEIDTLRRAIVAMQRKRAPRTPKAMSVSDGEALCAAVGNMLRPIIEKLDELSAKVATLETRRTPEYRGQWTQGTAYARGSMVSYGGSVWHSNQDSNEDRPGATDGWQLAVKRGRSQTAVRTPSVGR